MNTIKNSISSNDEEMDARAVEAVRKLPLEKIAKYSKLTLEQVEELSQLKEDALKIFIEKLDFAEKSIAEQGYYTEQEVEKELIMKDGVVLWQAA